MKLNGEQIGQLQDALVNAFITPSALEQMVSRYLNVNLPAIAGTGPLEEIAFRLIRDWANPNGRIEDLIRAALKARSRNSDLINFAHQVGIDLDAVGALLPISPPPTTPASSKGTTASESTVAPVTPPVGTPTYDAFISYSHQDQTWVKDWLVPHLRQAGLRVCVDYDGFRPGLSIVKNIEQAVVNSRKTLVILSSGYLESAWGDFENISALTFSMKNPAGHLIPVLYRKCDTSKIPLRIKTLIWIDFTLPGNPEIEFQRLVAAIQDQPLPPTRYVIPLEDRFPVQPVPRELSCPPGYLYLNQLDEVSTEHFYREQDSHVALLFPEQAGSSPSFLIDKYTITNQQFCMFLNDLLDKKLAGVDRLANRGIRCCRDNKGELLAVDARDYWEHNTTRERTEQLWGIVYEDGKWQPLTNCSLLPATLVSWWGAHLYSLWAHHLSGDDTPLSCLPTAQLWRYATQFDPASTKVRFYPWGNEWNSSYVNYIGSLIGKEVRTTVDRQRERKNSPSAYRSARPRPVADLPEGRSPIGCVQLLGNVWEWCSDTAPTHPNYHIIKGGACNSPQEHCKPAFDESWLNVNEYIGFRCLFVLA